MAYTTIDDPSAYFQTATYTGTGSTQSITNDGNSDLQPDLVWIKQRNGQGTDHQLVDSSRGNTKYLYSNSTAAEATSSDRLTSFNTDGFTLGADASNVVNQSGGYLYVGWQWKANGGTTSSNTDGTLTSTVQANTDAGFSIVTYSNPSTSDNTIGHGLGVQPEVIIFKNTVDVIDWYVASKYLSNYTTAYLKLNSTDVEATNADGMNSTAPTSSVFSVGGISRTGDNGNEVVAYCFASKQGFSKIGSYEGTGFGNGPYIYTGFKPAFVLMKNCNTVDNWILLDNKRDGYNPTEKYLMPSSSSAESTNVDAGKIDIYSNGFRIVTSYQSINKGSDKIFYMAFAENPFVTSTGIPTTAR
jgi:hypothetical protein